MSCTCHVWIFDIWISCMRQNSLAVSLLQRAAVCVRETCKPPFDTSIFIQTLLSERKRAIWMGPMPKQTRTTNTALKKSGSHHYRHQNLHHEEASVSWYPWWKVNMCRLPLFVATQTVHPENPRIVILFLDGSRLNISKSFSLLFCKHFNRNLLKTKLRLCTRKTFGLWSYFWMEVQGVFF